MSVLRLLPLFIAVNGGCLVEPEPHEAEATQAIVRGQRTSAFPAVGYVLNAHGQTGCGATLIGERTLVTAAHCLNEKLTDTSINLVATRDIQFYAVADAVNLAGRTRYRAAALHPHPDFAGGARNDIAVVILDRAPPTSIARIALATQAPQAGEPLVLLGHGTTGSTGAGIKRSTTNVVHEVREAIFTYEGEKNICHGDSGSATIVHRGDEDLLLGVHTGISGDCGDRGYDMRVDHYLEWITEQAAGDVRIGSDGAADPSDDDKADDAGGAAEDDAIAGCAAGKHGGAGMVLVLLALAATRRRHRR